MYSTRDDREADTLALTKSSIGHTGSALGVTKSHRINHTNTYPSPDDDSSDEEIHFPPQPRLNQPTTPSTLPLTTQPIPSQLSPLSMLFEGILADSATTSSCGDSNPFPYSPVSDSFSLRTLSLLSQQDDQGYSLLHSQASSPTDSTLDTPETSPSAGFGDVGEILDRTLAELLTDSEMGRMSVISQRRPLLGDEGGKVEEGSLLFAPFAVGRGSGVGRPPRKPPVQERVLRVKGDKDVDTSRSVRIDSVIDPHLATLRCSGFSSCWNPSPPVTPVSSLTIKESPPSATPQDVVALGSTQPRPPTRPPRPSHCSETLEDLPPFPSLRNLRKSPAEYLHPHQPQPAAQKTIETQIEFKLEPAPAKAARQNVVPSATTGKASQRSSFSSMLTFVSAVSELESIDEPPPQKPTFQPSKAKVDPVLDAIELLHSHQLPLQKDKRVYHPTPSPLPSTARMHPPQPLHLPTNPYAGLPHTKPSLIRKISLPRFKSPPTPNTTGGTDYSKQRTSFSLTPLDHPPPSTAPLPHTKTHDFPIIIISSSSQPSQPQPQPQPSRLRSFSSPQHHPPPSTTKTRQRTFNSPYPYCTSPYSSPASDGGSEGGRTECKGSLKRKPSFNGSIGSNTTKCTTTSVRSTGSGGGGGQKGILLTRKPSRKVILGSAERCVDELTGCKKVSFGEVREVG
ncbi:uncharacterized protein SPSC_05981 [Sporisorium scitamineum]|uniref:Uncharacterized protein n=1 Tax=Sporisorium scitamineum TaxID=49012 RepID=A0A127ZI67_9BASI|nr:uncharacterized protein SPSC_05981 [Sporisorium scitamineum]